MPRSGCRFPSRWQGWPGSSTRGNRRPARSLGHAAGAPSASPSPGASTAKEAGTPSNRASSRPFRAFHGRRSRTVVGAATCCNDAAAATFAEAHFGAGRGSRHFAYLTVSTGVGGGIVLDGRLLQSRNGLAGHVGFVSSPFGRSTCGSGRHGTVESTAAGRAIAAEAEALGHAYADARAVFEAAAEGRAWAESIIAGSARAVATLIADLTAIVGLDRVAIGGSVGLATGYLDRVRQALAGEPELFRVELVRAGLGHDSALLGALALRHLEAG
ncbi:MAG: ROK family protein [Geminicoccaceae bacterium]